MKADWIVLGACAAFTAFMMSTHALEPDATDASTPNAVADDQAAPAPVPSTANQDDAIPQAATDEPARVVEPVRRQSECSTDCLPVAARNEPSEESAFLNPGDCSSIAKSLQIECAASLRDRVGDPEFERSVDQPGP